MPMTKVYYIEGLTRNELFLDDILIAGAASMITKTLLAPSERIHLNMVNQNYLLKHGLIQQPYTNFLDCAAQIYRSEGVRSFWRGNLANLIGHFPSPTLNITFKDELKISFNSNANDRVPMRLCKNMASGCIAGVVTLCFIYPLELAKSKLTFDIRNLNNSNNNRQYKGLMDVYQNIVREKGYLGLYKGFTISCLSTFIYRGLYFGLYDTFKPALLGESPTLASSFVLGYFVSVFAGFASYPVDTVKRRMAIATQTYTTGVYKNSWDCFRKIVKREGAKSLMRGSSTHFLRALDGAGFLMGFDELVYIIMEKHNNY